MLRSTQETVKMYVHVYVKHRYPGNNDVQYKQRCKVMTEPDSETKISIFILCYRYLIGMCCRPLLVSFGCFHTKTDYLRQIYRDTRHVTLYNGTVPVCPQQRTAAFKWHVIAAVLSLRVHEINTCRVAAFLPHKTGRL